MRMQERGPKFIDPKAAEFNEHIEDKKAGKKYREWAEGDKWGEIRMEDVAPGDAWGESYGNIEKLHGVNFIEDIIPKKIKELGDKRKPKILIMGGGLGFQSDQIRHKFGKDVKILGTTLKEAGAQKRKREIIEKCTPHGFYDESGQFVSVERSRAMHKVSDGKIKREDQMAESIIELRDFPEFDLIIDTYGELAYAVQKDEKNKDLAEYPLFSKKIKAAIKKLLPQGELYMARIESGLETQGIEFMNFLWPNIEKLEKELGVEIRFSGKTKKEVIELLNSLEDAGEKITVTSSDDFATILRITSTKKQYYNRTLVKFRDSTKFGDHITIKKL